MLVIFLRSDFIQRCIYFAGGQDLDMDVLISREHRDVRSDVRSDAQITAKLKVMAQYYKKI